MRRTNNSPATAEKADILLHCLEAGPLGHATDASSNVLMMMAIF